jgi:hypothetical protein
LGFSSVVSEAVLAFEVHSIGAVPEQALLSMIELKVDVQLAEIEGKAIARSILS